ncbi:MAG TPA: UDP-glucose 4-epimerase GalE [Bacilli bacterium]|nr:MAG: UDP-glucose 4-epimerase [Tenericutes bacterium ADurb.BinA124]HNZ50088.1 UDP-glucose 4-epimerase GalE [Bacilli bacterium]HPX83933.1 UDP-glucose 4-epimerase GalE [Bacilli bacterium]HQC74970.1 UDP-glucose 4-epimerase GalE [Bacilli bacterium]
MKVLIAGGAGYIGSHCVKRMSELGYEVVVVDNLSTGHRASIKSPFYLGDIRDAFFLDHVFEKEKVDLVIHFCAKSLVGESVLQPLDYFENNVFGTLQLLQAMQKAKVNKIVFSSSAAVYGEHEIMPITEDYPTIPTNPYGETKLMMEKMMKWAEKAYGLKYMSLRYFNVAGACESGTIGEDHHPETHLIPLVLEVALGKRAQINVFGNDYPTKDGTCIRDYIHVSDLIEAHILAAQALLNNEASQIFNLGSEEGFSVLEIIKTASQVTKVNIPYQISPRRPGDPAKLVAASSKIKDLLGWEPKKSIEDIVRTAWEWHRNHPQGYEK